MGAEPASGARSRILAGRRSCRNLPASPFVSLMRLRDVSRVYLGMTLGKSGEYSRSVCGVSGEASVAGVVEMKRVGGRGRSWQLGQMNSLEGVFGSLGPMLNAGMKARLIGENGR